MENLKDIIIRHSDFSVEDTVNRIAYFLQSKGITIYARVDQQKEMANIGKQVKPVEMIMFGNPAVGYQAISVNPVVALDLPLKILVWEKENGEVCLAYNSPSFMAKRYDLETSVSTLFALDILVNSALSN